MFRKISHVNGVEEDKEILFSTRFDYLFPEAARSEPCLLPDTPDTTEALKALGTAMASDDLPECSTDPDTALSRVPAIYTYFGQFIDHDLTARTDRDGEITTIAGSEPIPTLDPDVVVAGLRNGRRPEFDLDAVFGESPGMAGLDGAFPARAQSQDLFESNFAMKVYAEGNRRDVVRKGEGREAIIPDERNDENLNLSQLQCAMVRFYNRVHAGQKKGSGALDHIRARQLCRWAFQYVVLHDWLPTVCNPNVVADTLANGPRFFGPGSGRVSAFMPLEFSTAGFRFAHSMIRPSYQSNAGAPVESIIDILGFARSDKFFAPSATGQEQLSEQYVIDWNYFVRGGTHTQFARRIDTRIARGLGSLPFAGRSGDPVLGHLARSNLLRAKNLAIPTGQAIADAFGIIPLTPDEIVTGEDPAIVAVLRKYNLHHTSPLWYYVLREAMVQQDGQCLGEIGSRIVCETIVGMIRYDLNSYFYNWHDPAVTAAGIDVLGCCGTVSEIADILRIAEVY